MKVRRLIEQLEAVFEEHGDIDTATRHWPTICRVCKDTWLWTEGIEVREEYNGKYKVAVIR